ncbi:hypothetical protein SARC_14793, partial [Sphaeroforma arctica JP610]
ILDEFVNRSGPSSTSLLDTGVDTIRRTDAAVGVLSQLLFDQRILPAVNFSAVVQFFVLPYLYPDAGVVLVVALRLLDECLSPQTHAKVRSYNTTSVSVLTSVVLHLCELLQHRNAMCRVLAALGSSLDTVTRCLVRAMKTLTRLWGERRSESRELASGVECSSTQNGSALSAHTRTQVGTRVYDLLLNGDEQKLSDDGCSRQCSCSRCSGEERETFPANWLRAQMAKFGRSTG